MARRTLASSLAGLLLLAASPGEALAQDDLDDILDLAGDELGEAAETGVLFRLVRFDKPDEGLGARLFRREFLGLVAAEAAPPVFTLDGADLIAPRTVVDPEKPFIVRRTRPTEARRELAAGEHILSPGDIRIDYEGRPRSDHPAVRATRDEVLILCAPVRLGAAAPDGAPAPVEIELRCGATEILEGPDRYLSLVAWLPVGLEYRSSLGAFAVSPKGEVVPGALAPGVALAADRKGLVKSVAGIGKGRSRASAGRGAWPFDTVTARGIRWAVTRAVAPGEPVLVATSARGYERARGGRLSPSETAYRPKAGPPGEPAPKLAARTVPAELARRHAAPAARALGTSEDDLAWLAVPTPAGRLGSFAFRLEAGPGAFDFAALVVPGAAGTKGGPGAKGPWLVPHRMRTAFERGERAVFHVIVPPGFAGDEGEVVCVPDGAGRRELRLGALRLPPLGRDEEGFDSRAFALETGDLPPGDYGLGLRCPAGAAAPVPLTILPAWLPRSPFFVHTMSGCTGRWPTSAGGLAALRDAGIEMATATGHVSMLSVEMPALDGPLAARLGALDSPLPPDLALRRRWNDDLLDRMLRARLRMIDLAVLRGASFYNESLSYHHSYKPSVDRMVRRMQVFTQQTGGFPSWLGVNYSWFPVWSGYVEAGVATDAHTGDRNRALAAAVKASGVEGTTRDERAWYERNRSSPDPATRERALAIVRKAVRHWNAREDLAWGRHNKLYNDAVREVRPGTVCTLFENAGHDTGKRTRALFNDMAAACYESYTDFGEWPMSAAFTTDWARGHRPDGKVWLTVDWGASSEAKMKAAFHAFGRGLAGGGTPMQEEAGERELARRGTGTAFLGKYGAIAARARPDDRFAVLATAAHRVMRGGHREYDYHAVYCHLTRLGCAPVVVADEDVAKGGVPASTRVLFIVREEDPLLPEVLEAIRAFRARGGRVLATADCVERPDGAEEIPVRVKNIWEMSGFAAATHGELWREFEEKWRAPLAEALSRTGVPPLARTDPDRGVVVALEGGPVRYVVVTAGRKGAHANEFAATEGLPVSVGGTGWRVRDLVKQLDLPAREEDGRTVVEVDLVTEPTTILACFRSAPASVTVKAGRGARLGGELALTCSVAGEGGAHLGPVPVAWRVTSAAGRELDTLHRAAGDVVRVPLAALDAPGTWKVVAQELLTGVGAAAGVEVAPPARAPRPAEALPPVHVVNEGRLRAFARRPGEKLIIMEPGQRRLAPVARELAKALADAGVEARVWEVAPHEFDTIPLRWYPRPEDTARLDMVAEGKLVGLRGHMKPYIDKKARAHVPERGGHAAIDPAFMVGRDCVVFSGGWLAESLRAVTPWMGTPSVPGRGEGRLVACMSPFTAGRHAVAVVSTDLEGARAAAKRLGEIFRAHDARDDEPKAAATPVAWETLAAGKSSAKIAHSYAGYTPRRRARRLLAARSGRSVLFVRGNRDTLAFVDERGRVTATVAPDDGGVTDHDLVDSAGNLWRYTRKATAANAAWHFATAHTVTVKRIRPDGAVDLETVVYDGPTNDIAPEWWFEGSFPVAPDGRTALLGRIGGFLLGRLGGPWRWHDDLPRVRRRFEVRTPRFPVGVTFSPEGRCVFLTMDTRPAGFGPMNERAWQPCGNESALLDARTGERLWSLRGADPKASEYAAHPGFVAVSRGGDVTAFADFKGIVYLVSKSGVVLARESSLPPGSPRGRMGPTGGVGVWISDDGALAAFGFERLLMIARSEAGKVEVARMPVEGLTSGCVLADGSAIVAGFEDGKVRAFAPYGPPCWELDTKGVAPLVAAGGKGALVATSLGELVMLDARGAETWRVDVAAAADREKHALATAPDIERPAPPGEYRGPGTLELAKARLGAERVAAWKPAGAGREAFGRTFFPARGRIELRSDARECFVHLVYRKPEGNPALAVVTEGRDGRARFELDLPAPEFREVDIPARGPGARVAVEAAAGVELAECSLWGFRWPGANLAYVRPPGADPGAGLAVGDAGGAGGAGGAEDGGGGLGDETDGLGLDEGGGVAGLDEGAGPPGGFKECLIWVVNPDIDQIAGPWLRAGVDPMRMVDGKRFVTGGVQPPWATKNFRGAWLTIDFGRPVAPGLAAVYDRATRQSGVARNVAVFTGFDPKARDSGEVLGAAVESDQFWRLIPLKKTRASVLGVHVLAGAAGAHGLSEFEAYPAAGPAP